MAIFSAWTNHSASSWLIPSFNRSLSSHFWKRFAASFDVVVGRTPVSLQLIQSSWSRHFKNTSESDLLIEVILKIRGGMEGFIGVVFKRRKTLASSNPYS